MASMMERDYCTSLSIARTRWGSLAKMRIRGDFPIGGEHWPEWLTSGSQQFIGPGFRWIRPKQWKSLSLWPSDSRTGEALPSPLECATWHNDEKFMETDLAFCSLTAHGPG